MVNAVTCLTVLLAGCFVFSEALNLPSYIKPCSRSDPKFRECAIKSGNSAISSIIKGDRKYRFPKMDPLEITEVSVDDRGGPVGVSIGLKNLKLHGFANLKLENFDFDTDKKVMLYNVFIPRLEVLSDYTISGKILILPVTGQGDANFTLFDLRIVTLVPFDYTTKSNGKVHLTLKENKVEFTVKHAILRLDNLFNGDKLLGEQMNLVINDNWKELVKEVGTPITDAISQSVQQGFNYLVDKIPFNELYLE